MGDWSDCVGRSEHRSDVVSEAQLAGLAALLDHEMPPWFDGEPPPLFHWFHFLPRARQSELGRDGHPLRGGFMPPIDLPRRMWAGSRVRFAAPVELGAALERKSTITAIREKTGASGPLVFVTVRHEIAADGVLALEEEQDIVYRGDAAPASSTVHVATETPEPAEAERSIVADPMLLFRFSALTFNAHRIHYDREYARNEEGYPGLVVHGPLLATLLMDHALRNSRGRRPAAFAFTARRPLFDGQPFDLCLAEESGTARLWTRDGDGGVTMTATLDWATP